MKRFIAIILSITTLICTISCFSGCDSKTVHILTRGEWVDKLAKTFEMSECYDSKQIFKDVNPDHKYFQTIQACCEWEIVEPTEYFYPDDRADVSFAISTAIKAVGLDKIEKSVDGKKLRTDEEIIDYFNEKCSVNYIKGSNLYEDTADNIINEISLLYASLQLKQFQDISLNSVVVEAKDTDIAFSADGETGTILKGNYNVGDIVSIEPCTTYPTGKYAKITNIEGNKVKYTEPTFEEMYDHVTMFGTYEPEIVGVVPLMDGVEVASIGGEEVQPQVYSDNSTDQTIYIKKLNTSEKIEPVAKTFGLGDIDLKINATAKAGNSSVTVSGGVKLKNIKATVDLNVWGPVIKTAELKLTDTIESSIAVSGQIEKTFNIAKVPCKLWGTVGVDFILAIKVGLEGSVSFVWSVDTSQSVEYKPLRTPKFHASGSNSNLDVELKAKAYIKPEFKAEFVIGPLSIANLGAYSGVEASAKTKVFGTSDDVSCVDVNAYIPLSIFVGAETKKGDDTLLGKLGVKKSWSIWTSSNSPWKKKWHIEEGTIVPKCTRKNANNNEESEKIDDQGKNSNDIDMDLINHIFEIDDAIGISSYFSVIDEGQTDRLKINHMPTGYDASTLIFSSSNNDVATVDKNGNITGKGTGVCVIKVSTKDEKYTQFCSVRVLASYDVNFTPLTYFVLGERNYVYSI